MLSQNLQLSAAENTAQDLFYSLQRERGVLFDKRDVDAVQTDSKDKETQRQQRQ